MLISNVLRSKGNAVERVQATAKVAEAVNKLCQHRIGALVVLDQRMAMAGIFSERDFIYAAAREGAAALSRQVSELMTSCVITCSPSDQIDTMLAKMTTARIRHLPVVENGQLVGIVSIGDLVKRRLEEKELEANVLLDMMRMRA
jgi:CBS domain-containing protein